MTKDRSKPFNKYCAEVTPNVYSDVYDLIRAYNVVDGGCQQALKKILKPGGRGHKDTLTDINESIDALQRSKEMLEEWREEL